ncbi:uncharacterized protein [Branchiostoma lanceolatum]|uniref:uncharacterized protein isoform X2 n=1 Tax=Branchiostoma lanceolatum TaxID=7740 RepID=UPI0034536A78
MKSLSAYPCCPTSVAPEHCPPGLATSLLNSTLGVLRPFDCPRPEDPPGNIYCCGLYSFRVCCPERCGDFSFRCPRPALSWPDHDNTGSSSDSGTYDSDDYYDSSNSGSGFSTGGIAILAVAFLCVVCTVTLCCKNAYKREEDLSRAMGSDGYVATYVDGTTLSSPGRARGRTQANAVNGTVVHPTVHVHPRSSDHHSNSSRTEPPTRGFSPEDPPPFAPPPSAPSAAGFFPSAPHIQGFSPSVPPPFAPPPSAPPTQGFPPSDPPPFAPPPLVPPTHYQGGTTPPVPSAAHGQPPFSDEPPPYDVATMFPTVDPQNR